MNTYVLSLISALHACKIIKVCSKAPFESKNKLFRVLKAWGVLIRAGAVISKNTVYC